MSTAFNLIEAGYTEQFLACHDVVAISYENLIAMPGRPLLNVARIRALNPNIKIFIYLGVVNLFEDPALLSQIPVFGPFATSMLPDYAMQTANGQRIYIWPIGPGAATSPQRTALMNFTEYRPNGQPPYWQRAADYIVNGVIPAIGGQSRIDGIFIDNAYASSCGNSTPNCGGLTWMYDFYQTTPFDINRDGVADSDAVVNASYASAITHFYADLKNRLPGILLIGNAPYPADLGPTGLDGRFGESNGGACSFNSGNCAMANTVRFFSDRAGLGGTLYSIVNLENVTRGNFIAFSGEDAAAYAYMLSGFAYTSYDDGNYHNTPVSIPPEYANYAVIGTPITDPLADRNIYTRAFTNGWVVINGNPTRPIIVTPMGQPPITLSAGQGRVVVGPTKPKIEAPVCSFTMGMEDGSTVIRLETDAVCDVIDCPGAWWSTENRPLPALLELAAGGGPYRYSVQADDGTADGHWPAVEGGPRPMLGSTVLTNLQQYRPQDPTLFVFSVGLDCSIHDSGTWP